MSGDKLAMVGMFLFMIIPTTTMITLFSPSVQEAVDEKRGECNIYYEKEFVECISLEEAFKVNFLLIGSLMVFCSLVVIFLPKKYMEKLTKC